MLSLGDFAQLDLGGLRRVVLDRSSRMRDQVYPRLEFQDAAGRALMRVIGMEGEAPFEASLGHLPGRALFPAEDIAAPAAAPPDGEDCPATVLLRRLHAAGGPVRVALSLPGAVQSWEGMLPEPRLAMGFVNLIEPGFHLHLRLGSVTGFRISSEGWEALDEAGEPGGLTVLPLSPEARRVLEGAD